MEERDAAHAQRPRGPADSPNRASNAILERVSTTPRRPCHKKRTDPRWVPQVIAVPISLCISYGDYYKKADGYWGYPDLYNIKREEGPG